MTDAPKDQRIPIMMSSFEVEAIDDWRFENKIATRAEAVRRLCQIGIGLDKESEQIGKSIYSLIPVFNELSEAVLRALTAETKIDYDDVATKMENVASSMEAHQELLLSILQTVFTLKKASLNRVMNYHFYREAVDTLRAMSPEERKGLKKS